MIGGVFEILLFIFGICAKPISEHQFYLSAGRDMYMARTSSLALLNKNRKGEEEVLEEY